MAGTGRERQPIKAKGPEGVFAAFLRSVVSEQFETTNDFLDGLRKRKAFGKISRSAVDRWLSGTSSLGQGSLSWRNLDVLARVLGFKDHQDMMAHYARYRP